MKECVLLFLFICLCSGLQEKLHYRYKYVGSAFSGNPELSKDAAGWGMKAYVDVYVEKDDGVALFKLSDFKTARYNGDIGCDARGGIPENIFQDPEDVALKAAFESPFKVHFHHNDEDYAIEYEETKFRWLPNMRKGIAAIFKNEILKGNFDNPLEGTVADALHKGHVLNIFSVQEETMFGRCKVDYSIYPIPKHLAGIRNRKFEEMMEEDEQHDPESAAYTSKTKTKTKTKTGKTSKKAPGKSPKGKIAAGKYTKPDAPKLKRDLWHVVRSVDFDECDERVEIQTTPLGFKQTIAGNQEGWTRSRSSVSEYIFRGSAGHFRLERAIVEGATTLAPIAMKTELFQISINQTLQLVSVDAGGAAPAMPTKAAVGRSKTWMYEMLSFAPPPKVSKQHPWVIYTGEGPAIRALQALGADQTTPEQISAIKAAIIKYIETVSLLLADLEQEEFDSPKFSVSTYMEIVSELMTALSKEDILEIFDRFFEKDLFDSDVLAKKLVVDGAAASGSLFAYHAIFDYIEADKIPDLQIITIFMGITNNAACPLAIPRIMRYVLGLDMKTKPFLAGTALLNLADLIHSKCVVSNARKVQYAGDLFGDNGCDVELVKNTFVPYLKDIILSEDDSIKTWEKEAAIRALGTLGISSSISILAPIVEGRVKCDIRLRSVAIYALQSWKLMKFQGLKKQVMDLLTDVYSDISEPVEVRKTALMAVISWLPDGNFWHRLARTSWTEPSKDFASFIAAIIDSYSGFVNNFFKKQNQAASHAKNFARPVSNDERYSYTIMEQNFDLDKHVWTYNSQVWHARSGREKSLSQPVKELQYFLMSSVGGIDLKEIELIFYSGPTNFMKSFEENETGFKGIAAKIAKKFYDKVKETISFENVAKEGNPLAVVYLRMLDHMHLFMPFYNETVSATLDKAAIATMIVQLASMGRSIILGKYIKPIDLSAVHPSELGLPVVTSTTLSFLISEPSHTTLGFSGGLFDLNTLKLKASSEVLTRVSSTFNSVLSLILPWNQEMLVAGITSKRDVVLPLNVVLFTDKQEHGPVTQDISSVTFSSVYKNKFRLFSASNTPYSAIIPFYTLDTEKIDFKILTHVEPRTENCQIPGKFSGLDFEILWNSELRFPFAGLNILNFIKSDAEAKPWLHLLLGTNTAKYWALQVNFNPDTSQTKKVTIEYSKGSFGAEKDDISQSTGQETQDYEGQFTQESQVFEQYDQEPVDHGQKFQDIKPGPEVETLPYVSPADTLEVRGKLLQKHFGGSGKSENLKVEFQGEKNRSYEVMIATSKTSTGMRNHEKYQISLLRGPIPGLEDNGASLCLDIQKSTPRFSNLDTVDHHVNSDIGRSMEAELTLDCKGKPIATLKGTNQLSVPWKEKLRKELPQMCDYDPYNPLHTFYSHAVYDKLNYTLSWNKVCDKEKHPLTTTVFNAAELLIVAVGLRDRCSSAGAKSEVKIDAYRCPIRGDWFLDIKQDDSSLHFEAIPNSDWLTDIYSINHDNTYSGADRNSLFNLQSETCVIGMDSVRTFDGFVYGFEGTQCWTVAAMKCDVDEGPMILVRAPEGESTILEAKYVDVNKGLVVDIAGYHVRVNGKEVDPVGDSEIVEDSEGNPLLTVYKKNGFVFVDISMLFEIIVTDKIRVNAPFSEKGALCGLCGNYNDEPEAELVGPHSCIYDNSKTFAASWTAGSDTCDDYTLYGLREDAEKYQKNCTKIVDLQNTCPYFNQRCFKYEWMIHSTKAEKVCVSSSPLPHCEEECSSYETVVESVRFRCWNEQNAPPVIRAAIAAGESYITSPISAEAHTYDYVNLPLPTACKHY